MKRAQLPVLSPCSADWDTMTSAGRARFCAECQTHVHHISAMSRSEAARFLHTHAGQDLCVRYAYDAADNVRFTDSASTAISTAQVLWPSLRAIAAASTLLVGAASLQISESTTTPAPATEVRCEATQVDVGLAELERARVRLELERKRAEAASEIMGRIRVKPQTDAERSKDERGRNKATIKKHVERRVDIAPGLDDEK